MKEIILMTSAGSMSADYLIAELKNKHEIIAVDIYDLKYLNIQEQSISKFIKVPKTIDEVYFLEEIKKIVKKEKITFILPLTDIDVDFFSKHRMIFKEQCIAIPEEGAVYSSRDKYKMFKDFKKSKINLIATYLKEEVNEDLMTYPTIAKPRNGRSSIDNYLIKKFEDLNYSCISSNHILQPFLDGEIITIDVVNDINNNFNYCARKEIIRSKNGAGLTVEYLDENIELNIIIREIINLIKIHGVFNIELILYESKYYLIDINPRPSAGLVFSCIYGYNYANQLIDIYRGHKLYGKFKYSGVKIVKRMYREIY